MKDSKFTLIELFHHIASSHPELRPSFQQILSNLSMRDMWTNTLGDNLSVRERFESIYQNNLWGSKESRSGLGSELSYTESLRSRLPEIINKYAIKSIFDAPCGDFNWMRVLLPEVKVKYLGGDIVSELISNLKKSHQNEDRDFQHINLIEDPFPKQFDLMICRDCLIHLSFVDISKVLKNFLDSQIPYMLTTTHITVEPNQDIKSGDFRRLNLFLKPFLFDSSPLERIDDFKAPNPPAQMCLWTRDQILSSFNGWDSITSSQ